MLVNDPLLGKAFGDDKVLGDEDSGGVSKRVRHGKLGFCIRSDIV